MATIIVPRTFGGTLLIAVTIPPPVPASNCLMQVRAGTLTTQVRAGTLTMKVRDA